MSTHLPVRIFLIGPRAVYCDRGARDRAQLVVIAYETGLVQPGTRTSPA